MRPGVAACGDVDQAAGTGEGWEMYLIKLHGQGGRGRVEGWRMTSVKSKVFTFTIHCWPRLRLPPPEHDADIITAGLQSERGIFYCVRNILCK